MAEPMPMPGQPPQAPFGQTGATSPTPNLGYEAAGLQQLGSIVKKLEDLIPMFGATTEAGQAVMDCLKKLVKFVPPGSVTPASEQNMLQQAMMKNTQNNAQVQSLRAAQAPPGGAPPMPPAMPKVA